MVFKSIRGSRQATVATCRVGTWACPRSKIIPRISRARLYGQRRHHRQRLCQVHPVGPPHNRASVQHHELSTLVLGSLGRDQEAPDTGGIEELQAGGVYRSTWPTSTTGWNVKGLRQLVTGRIRQFALQPEDPPAALGPVRYRKRGRSVIHPLAYGSGASPWGLSRS